MPSKDRVQKYINGSAKALRITSSEIKAINFLGTTMTIEMKDGYDIQFKVVPN